MKQCNAYRYARPAATLLLAGLSLPAGTIDFKLGDDVEGKVNATATAGTMIRTGSPDPRESGGAYNTLADRDNMTLVVGMNL